MCRSAQKITNRIAIARLCMLRLISQPDISNENYNDPTMESGSKTTVFALPSELRPRNGHTGTSITNCRAS
jgi:hypothetical protein